MKRKKLKISRKNLKKSLDILKEILYTNNRDKKKTHKQPGEPKAPTSHEPYTCDGTEAGENSQEDAYGAARKENTP